MQFYSNFSSMFNAQSYLNSNRSVFNRKSNGSTPAPSNPKFDEYTEKYMPTTGDGKNDVEKMLIAVNKLGHRFNNDGECLNKTPNYNLYNDEELRDEFYSWLQSENSDIVQFLDGTDYYDSEADFEVDEDDEFDPDYDDPTEYAENKLYERLQDHSFAIEIVEDDDMFKDWYDTYYDGEGSGGELSHDSEDENWLDDLVATIYRIDPDTLPMLDDLRISDTDDEYIETLTDLVTWVTDHLSDYDGFGWKFSDIPKEERKSWFE